MESTVLSAGGGVLDESPKGRYIDELSPDALARELRGVNSASDCALEETGEILLILRESYIAGFASRDDGKIGGVRRIQEDL
jgi:hypothetical protein